MTIRRLFLSLLFITAGLHLGAVPALQRPRVHTQPDGTTLTLTLVGDERAHVWTDSLGRAVTIDSMGWARVAAPSAEQWLAARRDAQDAAQAGRPHLTPRALRTAADKVEGQQRGLIVLVDFSDLAFNNTREAVSRLMNEEGYADNGATGSARDYFVAQSMGVFQPTFDVVGPVTLEFPYRYYGGNLDGSDRRASTMIFSAVLKATQTCGVNLADYDSDGDRLVDMVYVIYAGLGEADGGDENTIWPHMSNLQGDAQFAYQTIDGLHLGLYACSAEKRGDGSYSGIGTFCHEYGHCLGLADHYDVTYSGGYGMGYYDVMGSGAYLNNGNTPPAYNAFERMSLGWLTPTDVTAPQDFTLQAISEGNEAVRLTSRKANEYFLLENRQQQGWDAYLPARGLMITHIDYDEQVWQNNAVNADPDHQRVKLMAADNNWSASTRTGDLYPGLLDNTSFTDTSTPSSLLWDGTPLGKPVTAITMTGTTVSFHVGIDATGIQQPFAGDLTTSSAAADRTEWFTLQGVRVATGAAPALPAGVYILRDAQGTSKVQIRR